MEEVTNYHHRVQEEVQQILNLSEVNKSHLPIELEKGKGSAWGLTRQTRLK